MTTHGTIAFLDLCFSPISFSLKCTFLNFFGGPHFIFKCSVSLLEKGKVVIIRHPIGLISLYYLLKITRPTWLGRPASFYLNVKGPYI